MVLPINATPERQLSFGVVLPPDANDVSSFDQPPAGRDQRHGLDLPEVELLTQDQHLLHSFHIASRFVAFFDKLKEIGNRS